MTENRAVAPRLFLLRHGQSVANVERRIVSSAAFARDAYGLTLEGREQVRRSVTRARADGILPASVEIVSSPLLRALESARVAAEVLCAPVCVDDRLIERAFGELELESDDHYERVWSADRTNPDHVLWGVESATSILKRVNALLRTLEASGGTTYLLCTHGDVASVLLCASAELPLTQHREVGALQNGEIRALHPRLEPFAG